MWHRLLLGATYYLIYLSMLMAQQGVGDFLHGPWVAIGRALLNPLQACLTQDMTEQFPEWRI